MHTKRLRKERNHKTDIIMNIYLLITLFVYAVSLHRGLKSGDTLHIMFLSPNSGEHVPPVPP